MSREQQTVSDARLTEAGRLFKLAAWIRTPGNINPDDAVDECARLLENNASLLQRLSGEPTPPATPQPETPDPWVNALRTALDAVEQTIQQQAAQIETLTQEVATLRGAIAADTERLRLEGARVGIEMGCDTPHWMAEEILALRASRPTEAEQWKGAV